VSSGADDSEKYRTSVVSRSVEPCRLPTGEHRKIAVTGWATSPLR
jgi:hypothetical protein